MRRHRTRLHGSPARTPLSDSRNPCRGRRRSRRNSPGSTAPCCPRDRADPRARLPAPPCPPVQCSLGSNRTRGRSGNGSRRWRTDSISRDRSIPTGTAALVFHPPPHTPTRLRSAPVPYAKRIRLPPIHAVDGQSLLAARGGRPGAVRGTAPEVCVRRRDLRVPVGRVPSGLVGARGAAFGQALAAVQVRVLARPCRWRPTESAVRRQHGAHELSEPSNGHIVLVE